MKRMWSMFSHAALLFACLVTFLSCPAKCVAQEFLEGDIIFQASLSSQSRAIQLATHSQYSHVGIVYMENGQPVVFEAVGPVKTTPLSQWISRGEGGKYMVKRLKDRDEFITPQAIEKMKALGGSFEGKPYDLAFEWSNDRLYCSELVWKLYKEGTGLEIGSLRRLKDFDLTHPLVQKKLKERYGNSIPMNEPVISPGDMFDSELLILISP